MRTIDDVTEDLASLAEILERIAGKYRLLMEAVDDLALQFGIPASPGYIQTGGMASLERAFELLGWSNPHEVKDAGLSDPAVCGSPPSEVVSGGGQPSAGVGDPPAYPREVVCWNCGGGTSVGRRPREDSAPFWPGGFPPAQVRIVCVWCGATLEVP